MDSMEDSPSSSSCPDVEHCISESKSNPSLSVGYLPTEGRIDCEDIMPCEDLTTEGPSDLFLPPGQGAWGTKSVRRPMGRGDEIQDKLGELGEEAVIEILCAYLTRLHEDSLANWTQSDDYQRMDKCQQETITQNVCELDDLMTTIKAFLENPSDDEDDDPVLCDSPQEEDLQVSSSLSSHTDEVRTEDPEACQDLPSKPPENGDIKHALEMPPRLEDDEIVEMETKEIGTAESTSVSSEQSEEEDMTSDKECTSCVNFRGFFHWLRKRVFSSLPRRKSLERTNKVPFFYLKNPCG